MKNLLQHSVDVDSFDELPNRSKIPKDSRRGYRGRAWRSTYPHNKVLRFLESRVGHYWNDVFSEFCHLEWMPEGHKTKEQLSWNVIFETTMKDGVVHFIEEGSGDILPLEKHWRNRNMFYIHPTTQRLCRVEKKKEETVNKPEKIKILGNYHQLVKVKGFWYEVKGEPKDENKSANIIEKNGLHYQVIPEKDLPPIHERNFAWGKGKNAKDINYFDNHYMIVDGKVVKPVQRNTRSYYDGNQIGPKDPMVNLEDGIAGYYHPYNYGRRWNYDSIKITLYRQLTTKELKRHGLKNDTQPLPTKKCPKCGGFDCILHKTKEDLEKLRW